MFSGNRTAFSLWKDKSDDGTHLRRKLLALGIEVDENGHLFYAKNFEPIAVNYEIVFVRHGETYGNCGQSTADGKIDTELVKNNIKNKANRIYQGDVDTEINQLTEYGKQQAQEVAQKLDELFLKKGWEPDLILVSPLGRARDTAMPFIKAHQFEKRAFIHKEVREISFGSWDNKRISDLQNDDPCHLFYRDQNALVKCLTAKNNNQKSENFCEVLLRAENLLKELTLNHAGEKLIIFSHSMFGAACCMLLGRGQRVENGEYLAFDGKRKDGSDYTMPNAQPIYLTTKPPTFSKKLTA